MSPGNYHGWRHATPDARPPLARGRGLVAHERAVPGAREAPVARRVGGARALAAADDGPPAPGPGRGRAHAPPGRRAALRHLERHRHRRPPRGPRARRAARRPSRPPRQAPRADRGGRRPARAAGRRGCPSRPSRCVSCPPRTSAPCATSCGACCEADPGRPAPDLDGEAAGPLGSHDDVVEGRGPRRGAVDLQAHDPARVLEGEELDPATAAEAPVPGAAGVRRACPDIADGGPGTRIRRCSAPSRRSPVSSMVRASSSKRRRRGMPPMLPPGGRGVGAASPRSRGEASGMEPPLPP